MHGWVEKAIGLALLALLSVGIAVALPGPAAAQDIDVKETRRAETKVGPYTVVADASALPSLQSAQFFIRVTDNASGQPVEDLTVTILTHWSGSEETGENIALSPNVAGLYTATLKFDPGVWETTILLEPPGGGSYGADGFVFEVPEPSNNLEAGYVFLGVSVALLAGAGYLVWRVRRNQRQRAAGSGSTAA